MSLIHKAMIDIMKEISAISKSKRNEQQKFNYRGIDDVYNAVQPLFAKHGVVVLPEIISSSREERQSKGGGNLIYTHLHIKYKFIAEDASEIYCCVAGEGMDSGDKSSNKAMAVAHKYAILQTFCIPTEDMPDPDAESHSVIERPRAQEQKDAKVTLINNTGVQCPSCHAPDGKPHSNKCEKI